MTMKSLLGMVSLALLLGSAATMAEAKAFVETQGPGSPSLIEALRHCDRDLIAFYPYLYTPTVDGVEAVGDRAVMHHAECILYEYVPECRHLFGKILIISFFFGMEPYVFQQQDLSRFHRINCFCYPFSHTIWYKLDILVQ